VTSQHQVPLTELAPGTAAQVVALDCGRAAARRLTELGIYPGKVILKVSSVFARGPVAVAIDGGQVALGYGIASRILVREVAVE